MKLFARRYKHEKKTVKGTLKNALEGINYTYNSEINLRLHFLAAVVVFVACFIFPSVSGDFDGILRNI